MFPPHLPSYNRSRSFIHSFTQAVSPVLFFFLFPRAVFLFSSDVCCAVAVPYNHRTAWMLTQLSCSFRVLLRLLLNSTSFSRAWNAGTIEYYLDCTLPSHCTLQRTTALSQCLKIREPLPTENLLEDTDGLLLSGEGSNPPAASRRSSLLLSVSADVRSSGDVVAFEGSTAPALENVQSGGQTQRWHKNVSLTTQVKNRALSKPLHVLRTLTTH